MRLLQGMNGSAVRELQSSLNNGLNPSPNLRVSGLFDGATVEAVRLFQGANWLEVDGIAGPATLDALNGREEGAPVRYNVSYFAQPAPHLAWAAAMAMMRRSSIQMVRQLTPSRLLNPQGDLVSDIDVGRRAEFHRAFASQHGLRYRPPKNWSVSVLVGSLRNGPVMVEFLRRPSAYMRAGTTSHFMVIVGMRGAHTADGSSTTLRVNDPDQDHTPGVYSTTFASLLDRIPLGGYAIFSH